MLLNEKEVVMDETYVDDQEARGLNGNKNGQNKTWLRDSQQMPGP